MHLAAVSIVRSECDIIESFVRHNATFFDRPHARVGVGDAAAMEVGKRMRKGQQGLGAFRDKFKLQTRVMRSPAAREAMRAGAIRSHAKRKARP